MRPFQLDDRWWLTSDSTQFHLSRYVKSKPKDGGESRMELRPQSYYSSPEAAVTAWAKTSVREADSNLMSALGAVIIRLAEIRAQMPWAEESQ